MQGVRDIRLPHLPVRVQGITGVPGHPSGETLVQPKTVPEVHGDQVTKPLVGQLVHDNLRNTLLGVDVGVFRVQEQVDRSVGDQTKVLHGTSREVVDGNHVQLGQWVRDIEFLVEELERLSGNVSRVLSQVLGAGGGPHLDRNVVRRVLDVLQVTDNNATK